MDQVDVEPSMSAKKNTDPPFEQALERLEEIVERIEGEEIELDESLVLFEEGVRLLHAAEARLASAETRLLRLFERDGELSVEAVEEDR